MLGARCYAVGKYAIDESIRPFVKVLDSCGYKDILNANQVFTVWAPEITEEEAQEWIDTYKREKSQGIIDDDNSTLNQFIKNISPCTISKFRR